MREMHQPGMHYADKRRSAWTQPARPGASAVYLAAMLPLLRKRPDLNNQALTYTALGWF